MAALIALVVTSGCGDGEVQESEPAPDEDRGSAAVTVLIVQVGGDGGDVELSFTNPLGEVNSFDLTDALLASLDAREGAPPSIDVVRSRGVQWMVSPASPWLLSATMKHMSEVGIRALKQNASAVVADAAAGETVTITDRGRPVARMTPIPSSRLRALIDAGHARPAKRPLSSLPAPGPGPSLSDALREQRADGRF